MYQFSERSLNNMAGVHEDLVRVAKRAIEMSKIDFGITEGVRTYQRQVELMQAGKSQTLHSRHLIQDDGYGHAIDVAAYMNGKISWQNKHYGPVVQAFITAATALEVQLEFGHLWPRFQDSVHIQLNPRYYRA